MKGLTFLPHVELAVAGVVALVAFSGGMALQGTIKDAKLAKVEKRYAQVEADAAVRAEEYAVRVNALNAEVGRLSAERQETVRTVYRTLTKRVRESVPVIVPNGVVGGGEFVPLGALGLLDAAAAGPDAAAAFTAGGTPERATTTTFSQLVGAVVDNYGIAHGNAEQLRALIQWEMKARTLQESPR